MSTQSSVPNIDEMVKIRRKLDVRRGIEKVKFTHCQGSLLLLSFPLLEALSFRPRPWP